MTKREVMKRDRPMMGLDSYEFDVVMQQDGADMWNSLAIDEQTARIMAASYLQLMKQAKLAREGYAPSVRWLEGWWKRKQPERLPSQYDPEYYLAPKRKNKRK